jgi:hypothetical protein
MTYIRRLYVDPCGPAVASLREGGRDGSRKTTSSSETDSPHIRIIVRVLLSPPTGGVTHEPRVNNSHRCWPPAVPPLLHPVPLDHIRWGTLVFGQPVEFLGRRGLMGKASEGRGFGNAGGGGTRGTG